MKETVEAVFENGVFRPLKPPDLPEGQQVKLTVESSQQRQGNDLLAQAREVYAGLSETDIGEIEKIACDRTGFFSK